MKQPLINRLATRRSFAKTTLAGVGVFLGGGIWAEANGYSGANQTGWCTSAAVDACRDQPTEMDRIECAYHFLKLRDAGNSTNHYYSVLQDTNTRYASSNCDAAFEAVAAEWEIDNEERIAALRGHCCD